MSRKNLSHASFSFKVALLLVLLILGKIEKEENSIAMPAPTVIKSKVLKTSLQSKLKVFESISENNLK